MVPHTSSGTWRKILIPSIHKKAAAFRKTVTPAISTKEAEILSFNPAASCRPNRMENTAPLPIHSPSRMEVKNVISVNDEPTAANAFSPRYFPTIMVSAIL